MSHRQARKECRPPEYVRSLGWLFTTLARYEALRAWVPRLPNSSALFPLTRREVVAICQWEAPAAVLGRPFEPPVLRRDLLLAAEGDAPARPPCSSSTMRRRRRFSCMVGKRPPGDRSRMSLAGACAFSRVLWRARRRDRSSSSRRGAVSP